MIQNGEVNSLCEICMLAVLRDCLTKKWLVPADDLAAMYAHYKGKKQIPLWYDGNESEYTCP